MPRRTTGTFLIIVSAVLYSVCYLSIAIFGSLLNFLLRRSLPGSLSFQIEPNQRNRWSYP